MLEIDEAPGLHGNTLIGPKQLTEIIKAGGGALSIALVGYTEKSLAEHFDAPADEVNRLIKGKLDVEWTQELTKS